MNKKFLIVALITVATAVAVFASTDKSYSITSMFNKAFTASLSQGEQYERNITIHKFFNTTIRFKKAGSNSTSYLSFDNNSTLIVLKDSFGSELARAVGLTNGKAYIKMDYSNVSMIRRVSALGFDEYEDVNDQQVNVSYLGTTAYVTIYLTPKAARISGFVFDELTNQTVSSIELYAFEDNTDPNVVEAVARNTTDAAGGYMLNFNGSSLGSFDVYVKDYPVD